MSLNSEYKWMTGFLLGAALGAMGTLLLAPKSGRELRQDIVDEKERLKERANEAASELKHRGERAILHTKEAAQQSATGVKKAAQVLREGEPVEELRKTS